MADDNPAREEPECASHPASTPLWRIVTVRISVVAAASIVLSLGLHLIGFPIAFLERETKPPHDLSSRTWNPRSCMQENFPFISDDSDPPPGVNPDQAWKQRVLAAQFFCGRQWNPSELAVAARILDDHGMLLTTWAKDQLNAAQNAASKLLKRQQTPTADLYAHFSPEVGDFMKIIDASPLIVDFPVPESIRTMYPLIPPEDKLALVRAELPLNHVFTVKSPLPREITLRDISPQVMLITDVGATVSLGDVLREFRNSVAVSSNVRLASVVHQWMGLNISSLPTDNVSAAITSLGLATFVNNGISLRATVLNNLGIKGSSLPLDDVTVIFVVNPELLSGESIAERSAEFIPEKHVIYARRVESATALTTLDAASVQAFTQNTLPASLVHEISHYLTNNETATKSGFISEGLATYFGEYVFRSVLAGFAAKESEPDIALIRRLQDKGPGALTDGEQSLMNTIIAKRIRKVPFTSLERAFICLLDTSALHDNQWIRLSQLLSHSEATWQALSPEKRFLAYAEAWATFALNNEKQRPWFHLLVDVDQGSAVKRFAEQDARAKSEIADWIRHLVSTGQCECENKNKNDGTGRAYGLH